MAGAIAGRTTNGYPSIGAGYYSLVTNNADAVDGGITLQYLNNGVLTNGLSLIWNGDVGIGALPPVYKLDVAGAIHSSAGFVFPDGTTQTSALNSGGSTFTTADSNFGSINITLNGASIPVINFTRWAGTGSVQQNASVGQFFNPNTNEFDFGIGTGQSSTGNQSATTNALVVTLAGNVGIGTTNPTRKLHIAGDVQIDGNLYFGSNQTPQTAPYAGCTGGDYAESMDVTGDRAKYGPGDVLALDSDKFGNVLKSSQAYSTAVAGIYSTKPGMIGRRQLTPKSDTEVPMAMVGVVPTKVTAENGAIVVGDLLVSSSTPGYAMKGTDRSRMLGAVIGKAMGTLKIGTGIIDVLVTLQ